MIRFDGISKQHGRQILFVEASAVIHRGEKVGLVGPNGAGKSTLFRLVTREEQPDEGQVSIDRGVTVGHFSQDVGEMAGRSAVAETMDGAGPVSTVAAELHELEHALADPARADELDALVERFGHVQARFDELGGYALEARAREILAGLGFTPEMMDGDVGALSGGWKMRVALARILLMRPDAMLLDEPSNHLDLESIIWLEQFLKGYEGAILMTSHDREFMNRVVTKIVEIDGGELTTYSGDYDFYERERAIADAHQQAQFDRQQAMLKKELAFIERFKARASHAAQVQSRVKKLDKIEKVEPPKVRRTVDFEFRSAPRSGEDVAKLAGVSKRYGTRTVYDGLDFLVRRGERWCVLGANGAGKTTLLKLVAGTTAPDAGTAVVGGSVKMGYFAQHAMELLDGEATVWDMLAEHVPARLRRLAPHARRLLRLLGRRDREALPGPLRRREGAARARAAPVRPSQLPRPRRADEPPRRGDEGDARPRARRVRGDDAVRLARPAIPGRALESRARARTRRPGPVRRGLPRVRRAHRTRGARAARAPRPELASARRFSEAIGRRPPPGHWRRRGASR